MDVDLDPHRAGGDAVEREGSGRGEHGEDAKKKVRAGGSRFLLLRA